MHQVRSDYVTNYIWLLKNITGLKFEISILHSIKTTLYIIVGMFSLISIQFHHFQFNTSFSPLLPTMYQELGFHMDRIPIYSPIVLFLRIGAITFRFDFFLAYVLSLLRVRVLLFFQDLKPGVTDLPFRGVMIVFLLIVS